MRPVTRLPIRDLRPGGDSIPALALVAAVLGLATAVIAPFLSSLAWAVILGHVTWPMHRRVLGLAGGRRALGSVLTTGLVALALIVPLLWAVALLRDDLAQVYSRGQGILAGSTDEVIDMLGRIPGLGPVLHDLLTTEVPPGGSVGALLGGWVREGTGFLLSAIGGLGRNSLKFAFTFLFLFFVYRDGEAFSSRMRDVLGRLAGRNVDVYFRTASDTTRAITLSVVIAAALQGVVAALGYTVVGLSAPILLGILTALASVLPMIGTSLVWGSLAAWLLATSHLWQAVVLVVWGLLLVHPVDNVLRPWMVSSAAKMPFLMALMGVLGGLATFGFVGVVLGPVILAVGSTLWKSTVGVAGADD